MARDHERYLDTLRKVAEQKPPPEDKKEEYEDRLEKREAYLKHLKFMLDGLDGKEAYVVRGMHLDAKRSMRTPLNLWLVNLTADKRDHHWVLVDWTNPSHESTSGKYEAEEDSSEEAIEALLEAWDKDNSYPPGRIAYQFSVPERDLFFDDRFDTDGASFWDEVSAWLDYLALGAAVVAGVVTLIAPVPGSRVISAGIWASIFASTTAATINIAQRYAQGRSNWKDDAFDGLSIVGNLFAAAGVAWKVGATVTSTAGRLGPKMSKAVLIGQISSDGMQGILLSAPASAAPTSRRKGRSSTSIPSRTPPRRSPRARSGWSKRSRSNPSARSPSTTSRRSRPHRRSRGTTTSPSACSTWSSRIWTPSKRRMG